MGALKEALGEIKKEIVDIEQSLGSMEKLRDKIRAEFGLDEMRTRLLAIPEEIAGGDKKSKEVRVVIDSIQQSLKEKEAEIMYEISMETNGDKDKPKPKFSNDTARKAELTKRLKGDTIYVQTTDELLHAQSTQQNREIETDRLRNDFRVQMALKDLACAEMNLLGS